MATAEKTKTLDELREDLAQAAADERVLTEEVRELARTAERAVETNDAKGIKKVAARRSELPLLLKAAILKRAQLTVQLREAAHQEAEEERFEALRAIEPAREEYRRARERFEGAQAESGNAAARAFGTREDLHRAQDALAAAHNLDPDELVSKLGKEGANVQL